MLSYNAQNLTDGDPAKSESLPGKIAARVHRYFPDLSANFSIEVLHKGRPQVRKHSVLFEISVFDHSRQTTRGLFVKIPKRATDETVKGIYETLVTLYAFSTELPEELNVVRPLDLLPELRAIVTERVDGETLSRLLRSRRRAADHGNILENCGRFLRAYHDRMGQVTWQADFSGEFLNQCAAYLKLLEDQGVGKAESQEILAGFERAAGKLKHGAPICLTVKDYNVRNIIVQGKRIFFIEVTEPRRKTIYDDVAGFLNSLTMLFWGTPWFFLGMTPPLHLRHRFLAGYFADTVPADLVSLFCAKNLLLRWHRALESLAVRKHRVTGVIGFIPLRYRIDRFFSGQVTDHLQTVLPFGAKGLGLGDCHISSRLREVP